MDYTVEIYTGSHSPIAEDTVKFTNILCFYEGKCIFVRGKNKNSWELPGGHREDGESVLECAKRELYEETGASAENLEYVCARKIEKDSDKVYYGYVYFVVIETLDDLPVSEIAEREFFINIPEKLSYPFIQRDVFEIGKTYFQQRCSGEELTLK